MASPDLAADLRRLADALASGSLSERHQRRLAGFVTRLERAIERDKALLDLAAMLARGSAWETAAAVSAALERFHRARREPRTALERLCATVLSGGPPPRQRAVWDLLRENLPMSRPAKTTIEYQGNVLTVRELADRVGLATGVIRSRLSRYDSATTSGLQRIIDPRICTPQEAGRRGKNRSCWLKPFKMVGGNSDEAN